MKDYDLGSISTGSSGLDAFFATEPKLVTPHGQKQAAQAPAAAPRRMRVASLQQLDGFTRTAADSLIHKSTNDLWSLRADGDSFVIERLFDGVVKG